MHASVKSGNGGEGGEPSGSQELGGPPSVAQSPTAGEAVGVVVDGVVRACQAPRYPEVPHLPDSALDCTRGDISNSPLHPVLQFNHFTPNPSAPSPSPPSQLDSPPPLHVQGGMSSCAAVVFCLSCGAECGPDMQFNKCGSCLEAAFHAFAALHVPDLVRHYRNSSPSIEGPAVSAGIGSSCPSSCDVSTSASASSGGPFLAERARRLSPPHRKAGPPN